MKIIEFFANFALRVTEMLARFSLEILLALLKGAGKVIGGLLGGLFSARGRQPSKPNWKQHKPRRRRRKVWARRHRRA